MNKKIIIPIALLAAFFSGCRKEESTPEIVGFWSGNAIATGTSVVGYIGFLYRSDGTARFYANNSDTSMATKADGTYAVDSDSVRATVTSASTTSVFSSKVNGTALAGTFRRIGSSYGGTFSAIKQ